MKIFTLLVNCRKVAIAFIAVLFCLLVKSEVGWGQSQTFISNGTFAVPAGVTALQVEAWGGGGAGGGVVGASFSNRVGGGGSGGTYTKAMNVTVAPLQNITVTVGAGGTGVIAGNGNSGGTSIFASGIPVSAIGGGGGKVGNSGTPGAGGGVATGITFNGGQGATAASTSNSGGGGGGAGSTGSGGNALGLTGGTGGTGGGGAGANGLNIAGDGISATALAAGGSGGRSTGSTSRSGGAGFRGQVIVTWPSITGFGSSGGCAGSTIIINGENLSGATAVTIGGTAATITANTATQIIATIGNGTTGTVTVVCAVGTVTSAETFTVNPSPATTTVSGAGAFCGPTIITASGGSGGTIYFQGTTSNGTSTAIPSTSETITSSGIYYFRAQSATGCWGTEGSATVTINSIPSAVTVSGGGTFCGSTVIAVSGGSGGTVYFQGTTPNGTSTTTPSASQAVTSSGTYYFRALSAGGCWGDEGSVTVNVNPIPSTPTGNAVQAFCTAVNPNPTIADLVASGTGIQWYATPAGGSALPTSTPLVDGTHYYASQTDRGTGCESSARLDVNAFVSTTLTGLSYSDATASYCANAPIVPNVPTLTGGVAVSYKVSPALPNGLSLNTSTGEITGTPTTFSSATDYTITATNGCNSVQATISIAILTGAPTSLNYSSNTAVYCENVLITDNTPSNAGGAPATYSVLPALPAGLSLDPSTGIISGTPTSAAPAANYTITASNGCGSTTKQVNIAVVGQVTSLSYTLSTATYCSNNVITPNTVASVTGGGAITYTVNPALPAGLNIDPNTGAISGNPTTATAAATYTITASNGCSNAQGTVNITVITGLSNLNYSGNSATYCTNIAIANNTPSITGSGTITYSVSPALPVGLSLDINTGIISGTPTAAAASATYTVTATNGCSSTTRALTMAVITNIGSLGYSVPTAIYCTNVAITNNTPAVTGGGTITYSINPSLPAGLNFNTNTGVISGTPSVTSAATNYIVTASNGCSSAQATVNVTVIAGLANLNYASNSATYCTNIAIANNTASITGSGTITYSVSPALPAGLNLDVNTGIISGTPTAATASATYTVTATNGCSSTIKALTIAIYASVTSLSYTTNAATYCTNVAITNNTPTVTGGGTINYSVNPALPAGLSLNSSTGVISGMPTTATAAANYTITASNGCSSAQTVLNLTVITRVSGLNYTATTASYCTNVAIANNTPSSTGGGTITYSVSPALPVGLSLDVNTGVISGTPTAVTGSATYTVTATNGCSSSTRALTIAVYASVSSLSYTTNTATYCTNVAIANNTPAITGGGTITYSVNPALPAGLSLSSTTGIISGTPTTATTAANYTITASNGCSNAQATLNLTVITRVSGLNYTTTTANYCVNNAITSNTVSAITGGGTITYSVNPALPAGLSINAATGTISGTPTTVTGSATYTVTATNGCSSTTRSLTIAVIANISSLSYSVPTVTYCTGGAIANNTPVVTGGGTITYSVSPALPAGLSLSSTTGIISGTPTTATPAAIYTITASNGCSNAQATLNLTVITRVSGLNYTTTSASYCVNNAITPNTVSAITGGGTITYSVSPALPAGLSIDPATGTISGTPTTAAASATYTVTASNGCSSTTRSLTIAVYASVASLSYATNTAIYCTGLAITNNTPTVTGGGTITYSVNPALPAGLSLSSTTGIISGTPTTATPTATYTITASNACSNAQATLNLTVITRVSALNYTTTSASYCVNNAITPNTVSAVTGGGTITYSVSPALPAGLSIDPATGTISGTPTAAAASGTYTVTATNGCSNSTKALTIAVYALPVVTTSNTKEICSNSNVNIALSATTPSGFTWTLGTITGGITGANPGSGTVISDVLINPGNSATGTVEYIVTPTSTAGGCPGSPYTITVTVNPIPVVTTVNTAEICSGAGPNISLAATVPSSFSWTIGTITGAITGASAGSGSAINQTLINPSNSTAGTVQYIVTPASTTGTCNGSPYTITVIVDPTPVVTTANTKIICTGGNTNINLTASAPANFTWTVGTITGGITGASAGSGSSINQVLTNPGTSAGTVEYVVTPTATTGSCAGPSYTITVTVKAPVNITDQPASATTCASYPASFTVVATGDDLTYQWYKDGNALTDGPNISGSQAATLDINQASAGDAGTYYVIVTGSAACGPGVQSNTVNLTVNQDIVINNQPVSQAICSGSTATFTVNATGTGIGYTWRKGTTVLSNGVQPGGSVISGATTATLTITGVSAADAANNYNVVLTSPGGLCPGANSANVTLVVNPVPTVNAVTNKVICNGAASGSISFSGSVAGTVYNWTNDNIAIGLIASGTGNITSFNATNTGTAPITATITVTPTYTNAGTPNTTCSGTPVKFTITVNPTATVDAIADQAVCNGASTAAVNFTSPATGGTIVYNWTNTTPSIGLLGSGSGNIAPFAAINNTTAPVTATIKIKASYSNGSTTCTGPEQSFAITVNPTPKLSSSLTPPDICSNSAFSYTPTSATSGTTFNWSRATVAGISNAAAMGTGNPNEVLVNTTPDPVTITYVYTLTANGCSNSQNVTVTVNPSPTLTSILTPAPVCSNSPFAYTPTSGTAGIAFAWSRAAVAGISNGAASGMGNINETLINTTNAPVNVPYKYILAANGCSNTQDVIVTVNPTVVIAPLTQTICNNASINIDVAPGSAAGSITSWTRNNPAGITSTVPLNGVGPITGTFTNSNTTVTLVTFTINITADNGCASTATATVSVGANITAPTISSSQILCGSSLPTPLTSTAPIGGSGAGFNYQWYQSTDAAGPWAVINGAQGASYQPPNPGSNIYYYQLVVTDKNGCGTATSNIVEIVSNGSSGLTFTGSFSSPQSAYCSGSSFEYNETSINFFGTLGSGRQLKFMWQSENAGYFTSATPNPYGDVFDLFLFKIFYGNGTFTVHNSTNAPVTQNLIITPVILNSNGSVYCSLEPDIVPVTINPVPTIASASTNTCSGTAFNYAPVNGSPSGNVVPNGTKYSWSAPSAPGISGTGSGTNQNSVTGTPINNTNAPIIVTYVVTPSYTSGTTCPGTSTFNVAVTVNPKPKIPNQTATACSNVTFSVTPVNAAPTTIVPSGTTYTWSAPSPVPGISGLQGGTNQTFISGKLINSTNAPINVTYTVTPTAGAAAGSCVGDPFTVTITVNPTLTAGILSGTSPLCIGGTATYTSTGSTGGTWSSSNTGVATVNSSTGVVTAVSAGTTIISYSFNTGCGAPVSAQLSLTVNPDMSAGTISGTPTTICIGQTTTYTSTGNTGGSWSSSNTGVATVDAATGVVTGVGAGTANITYTISTGCSAPNSASLQVSVNPNATAGTVSGTSAAVCVGTTTPYTVAGNSAAGTWSSSNTSVATVDASGNVTAISAGVADIIYTVNSGCNVPVTSNKQITVNANANAGTITGNPQICVGSQVQFLTTGSGGGTWSSSDITVATVGNGATAGIVKAIGIGTATITYTITSGCGVPVQANYTLEVVNAGAVLNPGPISGPTESICANTPGLTYTVDPVDGASYYVWELPSGWIGTSTTNSITVTAGTASGIIKVTAGNACGFSATPRTLNVNVIVKGTWFGITANWSDLQNWCGGIPDATTDVTIPAVGMQTPYYLPVLDVNASVHNLTIVAGATVDLNGKTLTVAGAFSGTGTLNGSAKSGLTVTGSAGTVYFNKNNPYNQLKTLKVNTGGSVVLGGSVAAGDTLNIAAGDFGAGYGTVKVDGTLNTNGLLTMKSDVNGTARIDVSTGQITGNVTVERYIPARRAWRFMTVPFESSSQTIMEAWQEGVNNPSIDYTLNNNPKPGYGTHITGNNNTSLGFDLNTTVNPSLKVWDGTTNAWSAAQPPTISTNIRQFPAYCVFVRGSREVNLAMATSSPTYPTILRATGKLYEANLSGSVAFNFNGVKNNDKIFIGNPYVSPINLNNVFSRVSASSHITPGKFWIWNPNDGGANNVGAYVTFTEGIQAPAASTYRAGTIIQTGQAFMLEVSGLATPTGSVNFNIQQSDKSGLEQEVTVFGATARTIPPVVINANLMLPIASGLQLLDGVAAGLNDGYSENVDSKDATKLWNFDENMALLRNGSQMAIETRPLPVLTDTLFFRLYLRQKPYTLQVFAQNLPPNTLKDAWLIDKYLNTQTLVDLTDTTLYNFTPNTDTNSYRGRFMLVFSRDNSKPVVKSNTTTTTSIYPNPVSGKTFNLVMENASAGDYTVRIFTIGGRLAATRKLSYRTGKNTYSISLPATIAAGQYIVQVINSSKVVVGSMPLIIAK